LTLADYEARLTLDRRRLIRNENTSSSIDDLSIRRFGERLRTGSNSTDVAAEDGESDSAYAGNLNLSDIDDWFQLHS
jgi:hypothetical protein